MFDPAGPVVHLPFTANSQLVPLAIPSAAGRGGRPMGQPIAETRRRHHVAPGARVPPHNLQAEESLLGAMLLSKDAVAAAVEVVSADDFYKPAHGHIYDAITGLYG